MRRKTLIIGFALFVSIILNISLFYSNYIVEHDIQHTGTYICGTEEDDAQYIVLTKDNQYYKYKQFNMLERNKYSIDENNIISIEKGDILIWANDTLYYVEDDFVEIYTKYSDDKMFINVEE